MKRVKYFILTMREYISHERGPTRIVYLESAEVRVVKAWKAIKRIYLERAIQKCDFAWVYI
jgi:hypothetical protein